MTVENVNDRIIKEADTGNEHKRKYLMKTGRYNL